MTKKTYRFAAVAAVLLMLCLVFMMPVSATVTLTNESGTGDFASLSAALAANEGKEWGLIELKGQTSDGGPVIISQSNITIEGHYNSFIYDNSKWTFVTPGTDSLSTERLLRIHDANNVTLKNITIDSMGFAQGLLINKSGTEAAPILLKNVVVNGSALSGISVNGYLKAENVTVQNSSMMQSIDIHGDTCQATIKLDQDTYGNLRDLLKIGDIYRDSTVFVDDHQKLSNLNITTGVTIIINSNPVEIPGFTVSRNAWIAEPATVESVHNLLANWLDGAKKAFGYSDAVAEFNTVAAIEKNGVVSVYPTLATAVADAEAGQSIVLQKNVDVGASSLTITGKPVILDLNGFTISSSTDTIQVSGDATSLTVYDNSTGQTGKITTNGLTYAASKFACGAIWVHNGASVILQSGTLNSTYTVPNECRGHTVIVGSSGGTSPATSFVMNGGKLEAIDCGLYVQNGTATINNGEITADGYGISGNGDYDGTTITVNGGIITARDTIDSTGIYHPQNGKLTISGGEISGANGIQFVGDGTLTISGGTITGTNTTVLPYPILNSNGGIANGAALSIVKVGPKSDGDPSGYGTEALVASITGGTFSSNANDAIRIYGNDTANGDGVEGVTLLNPVKFIKGGIFTTAPAKKYLVDNYEVVLTDGKYKVQEKKQVTTTTTTTTTTSKPKEETQVEPVTPTEPVAGEVTVETEVTNGGEVSFETPAAEGSEPVADAPVEISAVVLPEGTTGEVAFIPVSEQPAPAGKETQTKKVFEINVPTYEKGKAAVVKFTMTVAELAADGKTAAEVALWHFDEETGEWTKLVTSYTIVDGVVYFEAITYDFSPFAIIYEDAVEQPEQPVEEPETSASPAPVLGVLAALGAAVVMRRK